MASPEPKFDFLDPPSQPGDLGTLSHYRVVSELGRGGMGFVFRAQDKRLQREVAMKVMNQKVASTPHSRRRFIHEARAMAAVHHDNVATIFEVGEQAGTPYMAMEMLKGGTLETFNMGNQRLGYEEIIRYATEIARGLAAAHAKGIVHRDIKPANIWIESEKNRIKILDFGLALAATPVDTLSGRGAVIGTPGYLSPEQARTEPLDDRSDLYSLGVVLYELCTGRLPLLSSSVAGQLIAIIAHRPQPIVELNPDIPQPLADLIHRLLYKEPRARVRSAAALEKELARVAVECHAKSEVAQTINKLQLGLEKVVSKKSEALFSEPIEEVEVLDPFASIPGDPLASAPIPAATTPAAPLTASPYARAAVRKPAPVAPPWQKYLPLAAIVAVALISLPIMTYAFTGFGRDNTPTIIRQSPGPVASNNRAASNQNATANRDGQGANDQSVNRAKVQNQDNNTQRAGENSANKNNQRNQGDPGKNKNGAANNGGQSAKNGGDRKNNPGQGNRNKANAAGTTSLANASPSAVKQTAENDTVAMAASPQPANVGEVAGGDPPAMARADKPPIDPAPAVAPDPAPVEPTPILETTSISTSQGRGADTMVQIGTTQNLGLKPSIGVHKRGKIDSHHSYLRFDLASIADVKADVASAELVFTIVGTNRPVGAAVRLYGIATTGVPLWQEEGPLSLEWNRTPSKAGLDTLPLLGTAKVTAEIDPRDGTNNTVRISNPELAGFIRAAADDTVTFVVAGNNSGRSPLRFVSREGDPEKAPLLVIEAAKGKPADPNNFQSRGRGRR